MRGINLLASIILLATAFTVKAQTLPSTMRVELDIRAIDDKYVKSMLVAPCFLYTNPIEEFRNIGNQNTILSQTSIRLPDMSGCRDTAYGFLFFGGTTSSFAPGYILFVVGNNRRPEMASPVWFDRNNNLDLSDDGPADTSVFYRSWIQVNIPSQIPGGGDYAVRLSRFPADSFFLYKNMVNDFYRKFSGTKTFAGANRSFREQRLNILAADIRFGTDSFRIGIKDVNCNGIYNEKGIDEVLVGEYRKNLNATLAETIPEKGQPYFEWELQQFRIDDIAANGKQIIIEHIPDARLQKSIATGSKLPHFRYCNANLKKQRKVSIRKFRGDTTFIFIWNSKHERFVVDSSLINELINKYPNIRVLCLNFGDSPKWVARYNQYYSAYWELGFSSRLINSKLRVNKLPAGILVDKKQRVINPSLMPAGLLFSLQAAQL